MSDSVKQRLVIGLGTGRCGTVSLSLLLNAQRSARVCHEGKLDGKHHLIPWRDGEEVLSAWIKRLARESNGASIYGDVGMYFLPYAEHLIREYPHIRFVCMKRDKESTVDSYMVKTRGRNHWMVHDGSVWDLDPVWDPMFPKYSSDNKKEALEKYWDDYYQEAHRLSDLMPSSFGIFDMDSLNSEDGRREVLEFVGFEEPINASVRFAANTQADNSRVSSALSKAKLWWSR